MQCLKIRCFGGPDTKLSATGVFLFLLVLQLAFGVESSHADEALERERALFKKVERSLKLGRRHLFETNAGQLRHYPLYPYLLLERHKMELDSLAEEKVRDFLDEYDRSPPAEHLRRAWLKRLARRGQWEDFADFYRESPMFEGKKTACLYAAALIRSGRHTRAEEVTKRLWLVNFSQPPQCDFAFSWGFMQGFIDDQLVWRRIMLVVGRNSKLGSYLGGRLSSGSYRWYRQLEAARRNPEAVLGKVKGGLASSVFARDVAAYALERLVDSNVHRAARIWESLKSAYPDPAYRYRLQNKLGIRAMRQLKSDVAYRWLSGVPASYRDEESRASRIRSALHLAAWDKVLESIIALTEEERADVQWRYWHAHALHQQGRDEAAKTIWREIADTAGYYGYLAADKLGVPYTLETRPVHFAEAELRAFENLPAVGRMRELIRLGRFVEARREFLIASEYFDETDFLRLAVLAGRWEWSDGAIRAVAKSRFTGDTVLRFPLPYRALVESEAAKYGNVSSEWIYGIIRRESAFVDGARSPAGALGLMQLMPRTARLTAARLKLKRPSSKHITRPDMNIRLGTAYFNRLYRRYGKRLVFSLAAYNAGGVAVSKWRKSKLNNDAVIWVEVIPFSETRAYVKAVLFYVTVYAHRLGKTPLPLKELMKL